MQEEDCDQSSTAIKVDVDADSRTRNVSRGLGSLAVQNIITSVLAFVFLATLVRLTSPNAYTAYSSVLVSVSVGVTVSTFALQYAAARYVALFLKEDEKKAWAVAKSIIVLSLVFSLLATIVFELLSPELSLYFMKTTRWTSLFILGGFYLFAYSFSSILQGVIQGMKMYTFLAWIITISRILMLGFAFITLELYHNIGFGIIAWVIYYAILILWPIRKIMPQIFQKSDQSYHRTVMKYSIPLAIATILGIISTSGDSIVIGGYTHSLGAYNLAIQISASLFLIVITPLTTALLPEATSSSGSSDQVSNVVRLSIRFLVLGLLPASLLLAALAPQLLSLFSGGGAYLSAIGPLEIISATYIFYGVQLMVYSILQAIGHTVQALIAGIAAAVADVGFALLLIPGFGMNGGASSRALETLMGTIVSLYFVRQYLGKLDSLAFYAKGIVASVVPFAAVYALSAFVSVRTLTLIPYSIIYAGLFLLCIKGLKVLNEEDRGFIAHLLPQSFKRLLQYL